MRRASTPIPERMLRYAWRIYAGGELTSKWMRERFGLSKMTAKRDMDQVLRALPAKQRFPTKRGVERRIVMAKETVRRLYIGEE